MDSDVWSLESLTGRLKAGALSRKVGHVVQVTGLVIESEGPNLAIGDVCRITSGSRDHSVYAEVVGFRGHRLLLMPLGDMVSIKVGSEVSASGFGFGVPVGPDLMGRVIDGLSRPIDGKGPIHGVSQRPLRSSPPNPLTRSRIKDVLSTGIRSIDAFTPVGCGQRMGIFSGSGVGKSTLLGMMARGAESDVNVIALVGERGRELREFIEKDLGPEGLRKSVIVVSTSDQPALVRIRAAMVATSVAEYFRDEGKKVLFMMDSVTRFAMAQREVGLAVGEPPSSRGYTPSVFALLPKLLERTGAGSIGSITAFYTVLVEGDDMNEPIADAVRGILDGHIILTRALATSNHFPAVDVLESVSRLIRDLASPDEYALASQARDLMALYRRNEDLITIGAYAKGANPKLDLAIAVQEAMGPFLRQGFEEACGRGQTMEILARIFNPEQE